MIEKYRHILDKSGIKYWDFRFQKVKTNYASAWNNEIRDLTSGAKSGHCIRVVYKNGIGFVYSENNDKIKETIEKAVKIAKIMNSRAKTTINIEPFKKIKDKKTSTFKINPEDISLEEKKNLVLKKINDKLVKSYQMFYMDIEKEQLFENSESSYIQQNLIYTYHGASVTVQNQRMENYDSRIGAMQGYELTKDFDETIQETISNAKLLLKSETIHSGYFPVICDSALTDVFIHEALGHNTEADIVMQKDSCIEGMENQKICPEHITVIDSPLGNKWGSYFYDDEGIPAQETRTIDKGILKTFLHSRETAFNFRTKPTGNARAMDITCIPQVRMSNTFLKKGDYDKEELFEGIKKGVFLKGSKGGEVNTSKGSFQFSAQNGFLIENGKITKPLREVSLSGKTLDVLRSIARISNKYERGFPGFCGKNSQSVYVSGDSPTVFIKNALVGGK